MELILNILPQEVLDNFSPAQPAAPVDAPEPEAKPADEVPSQKALKEVGKVKPAGRKKLETSAAKPRAFERVSKEPTPAVSAETRSG